MKIKAILTIVVATLSVAGCGNNDICISNETKAFLAQLDSIVVESNLDEISTQISINNFPEFISLQITEVNGDHCKSWGEQLNSVSFSGIFDNKYKGWIVHNAKGHFGTNHGQTKCLFIEKTTEALKVDLYVQQHEQAEKINK